MRLRHLVFPLFAAVACADPPRAAVNAEPPADLVVSVGHAGAPQVAAFVADLLVTGSWANIALIDLSTGLTIAHLPQESLVTTIEASPTDDVIAVGTCGHAVQLWNVKTRSLVRRIALSQECPESVAFSPDGSLLAVAAYGCCRDRGLQVWDLQSGALKQDLPTSSGIRSVAFSRDGGSLVGVDDDGKATVFEWPSGRHLQSFDGLEGPGFSETARF